MGLFDWFKKKVGAEEESCCCCCGDHHHEEKSCCCGGHDHEEGCCCGEHHHDDECCCGCHGENTCCGEPVDGICCIKILGACCNTCTKQVEYVKEAVKNLGLDVPVTQVEDMMEIMDYGVLKLPAVVVNDKVVVKGKAAKTAEIEKILKSFLG